MGTSKVLAPAQISTPSGIVVAPSDVVKVLTPGSFVVPTLDVGDGRDHRSIAAFSDLIAKVRVCAVHCFDGRDYWLNLWRSLLQVVPADELMRISLAGAATSSKRFIDYVRRYREMFDTKGAIYVVVTHDPCGRFKNVPSERTMAHGLHLCTGFGAQGYKSFCMHFHLDEKHGLVPIISDPFHVVESDPTASEMVEVAENWEGRRPEVGALASIADLTLCLTSLALGYPPPVEDSHLVLSGVDHGEALSSIAIAQTLKGGEPVPVRTSDLYYNQS